MMSRQHTASDTETQEEATLEFHVLRQSCEKKKSIFLETGIPHSNLQHLFRELVQLMGHVEVCKEYTKYVHWNMELTILPDGSSFCHQVRVLPIEKTELPDLPEGLLATRQYKLKIANDFFPSQYSYHSVCDTVDVIFPWSDVVNILLRLKLSENREQSTHSAKKVEKLYEIQGLKDTWCEVLLQAPAYTDEVRSALQFVLDSLHKKPKPTPSSTDDCSEDM